MAQHQPFRVALVRTFSTFAYKEPTEPVGIEALKATLDKNNIQCRIFDREMTPMDQVVDQIIAYGPALLGLSVLMEDNAMDAARLLLQLRKRAHILCVVGGFFVTTNYQRALALFPKDCRLVAGEGEAPLLKLCSEMNGIAYPDMDRPCLTPEEWPWLYRHNLQDYLDIDAPITMKSSRGCPGQCSFCATPALPHGLGRWVGRKISDVADEMEHLSKRYHPPAFNFIDDDFGSLARVEALMDALQARNVHCAVSLQLRANTVYNAPDCQRILRKLKAGGLYNIFIGIESFDETTLAYFNKRLDPFKALQAAQMIRDCGICVNIGYILWHPLSTVESVRREAALLHDAGFFSTKICISRLMLFPGCGLQQTAADTHYAPSMDYYYDAVETTIAPLYDAWLAGALSVPRHYCAAHLEPGGRAAQSIRSIEAALARIDELSFQALLDYENVNAEEIQRSALDAKERFHEAGCAFVRAR